MGLKENMGITIDTIEQGTLQSLTAVILAGGLGTRLRTVVHDRTKVMANVAGRPFLTYVLDKIVEAGIKRTVICTGFLADSISAVLKDDYRGLQIIYSHETSPLGTAGALRQALDQLKNFPTLVFNGDSYINVDLEAFVQFHGSHHSPFSLVLAKKSCSDAFGLVEVERDGVVARFSEKESTGKSEWVNAGIYLMEKPIFESIPEGKTISLEREIFPKWVGHGLHGYAQEETLFDIGTPSSLSEVQEIFRKNEASLLTCF